MASVVSAAIDKFNGLTAANFPGAARPPIYLDDAPQTDGSGDQKRLPYAILKDDGLTPGMVFDSGPVTESGAFTITLYYAGATPLAHADAAAEAVKYNGGTLKDRSGFDLGSLTLPAGYLNLALIRTRERRFYAGLDRGGARVHAVELTYSHEVQRT